jgi:Sulfotransferase family
VPADAAPRQSVFPFFVGCGRSGTTLFRAIFDSHPRMSIPGESHVLAVLLRRRHRYERMGFQTAEFLDDVLANRPFRRNWNLPETELRNSMMSAPPRDTADGIRRMFSFHAELAGKDRYGDKTPAHVLHIPMLASIFPESRFVHIIRDGRDVALSYVDVAWGPRSVEEAALRWKRFVGAGRQAAVALGSSRYREVRYEDFLRDPEATVRSLCPYLDLEFEDSMLSYFNRAETLIGSSRYPESHQHLKLPPTTGLRDWRTDMSRGNVEMFEALAGDQLSELGYERAFHRVSRGARVDAGWRRVRVETERHARKAVRGIRRSARRAQRMSVSAVRSGRDRT